MNNLKVFLVGFVLLFALGFIIFAQEAPPAETPVITEEAAALDEDIQPEDLGVSEPRLLPDSPFYFLKNWGRGIQSFFTFNPVKKAELRMKFANEKLMEAKKLVQKTQDPEKIKKAAENYQQEVERIKNQVEKIKEKAVENPNVESFLDKFIHQQTLHQKLLQKLETQVPPEAFKKIEEARERHLEKFQDVILKLEDRSEKITEKLDKILEEQKGSQFKEFKNLEILKNLEEKMPEEAKEIIKKAEENALKRLQGDLEKISSEDQERFKEYLDKISGEKEKHLEILENLRTRVPKLQLQQKIIESKDMILEKIKLKEAEKQKEEKPEVCITLWDPVCGKDGRTYSNECFAKVAGVEINYKGVCKEEVISPQPIQPIPTEETPVK